MPELQDRPTVEPSRYVDAGETVDEPIGTHIVTAYFGVGGLVLLMGLFFFSTAHSLHGWLWGLFAAPAVMLLVAGAAALRTIERTR